MGAQTLVPAGVQDFTVYADLALHLLCRHGAVSGATGKCNYKCYYQSVFWEAVLEGLKRVARKFFSLWVLISLGPRLKQLLPCCWIH